MYPAADGEKPTVSVAVAPSVGDPDTRSECSTVDTMQRSALSLVAEVVEAPGAVSTQQDTGAAEVPEATEPAELPSLGSGAHAAHRCKPCAFVHTKGCASGAQCQFCHLCGPGEKQRRQKEKRAFFGTMRQLQKMTVGTWGLSVAQET